jgi:hypothetical protein
VTAGPLLTEGLLEELAERWRAAGAPIADSLRPGLSDAEMDALVAPLGLRLPHEARVWWGWHDGARPSDRLGVSWELGPGFGFFSLGEAVALYHEMRELFRDIWADEDPGMVDYWWRPSWLPITECRGAVRCDCAVSEDAPTPIYWAYSHDHDADGLTNPKVGSFGTLVCWWIEALDSGGWRYDPEANRWQHLPELLPPERTRSGLV